MKEVKYEDIKFLLLLLFKDLDRFDYDIKMNKKFYTLSVRMSKDRPEPVNLVRGSSTTITCYSCKRKILSQNPLLIFGDFFHVNCIKWYSDLTVNEKLKVGPSSIVNKITWP